MIGARVRSHLTVEEYVVERKTTFVRQTSLLISHEPHFRVKQF